MQTPVPKKRKFVLVQPACFYINFHDFIKSYRLYSNIILNFSVHPFIFHKITMNSKISDHTPFIWFIILPKRKIDEAIYVSSLYYHTNEGVMLKSNIFHIIIEKNYNTKNKFLVSFTLPLMKNYFEIQLWNYYCYWIKMQLACIVLGTRLELFLLFHFFCLLLKWMTCWYIVLRWSDFRPYPFFRMGDCQ